MAGTGMLSLLELKSSRLAQEDMGGQHETVVVIPYISPERVSQLAVVLRERTEKDALLVMVEDDARLGFIMTANMVFARTRSQYFCYLAEDAFPGYYWLEYGLEPQEKTGAGLLGFSDGRFFGKLAAFGLARREWVTALYGGKCLFFPGYKSHFGDTELSVIAERTRNLVFNPNALMMEVDYEKHHKANNPDDEALYRQRAASGFSGLLPPLPPGSI